MNEAAINEIRGILVLVHRDPASDARSRDYRDGLMRAVYFIAEFHGIAIATVKEIDDEIMAVHELES